MHLSPLVVKAAVLAKVVIFDLLLIYFFSVGPIVGALCLFLDVVFAKFCVLSSFATGSWLL